MVGGQDLRRRPDMATGPAGDLIRAFEDGVGEDIGEGCVALGTQADGASLFPALQLEGEPPLLECPGAGRCSMPELVPMEVGGIVDGRSHEIEQLFGSESVGICQHWCRHGELHMNHLSPNSKWSRSLEQA